MNMKLKIKRFFFALLVSFLVALIWIIFLRVTLIGLIYWYASTQMGIAILFSIVMPAFLYACFTKRKNEPLNKLFVYSSLFASTLILLFIPEHTERAGIGILILPIILTLSFIDKGKTPPKEHNLK
jgi:hypothetical protein